MKKHRLLMLMFASAAVLFVGCEKEEVSESRTDPSEGGTAWPERRISSITINEALLQRSVNCHFTWNDNKISEIVYTAGNETISYSFAYKDDRVANTHYSYSSSNVEKETDFEYHYSNGRIDKVIIHIPLDNEDYEYYLQGIDEEHLPYLTVEYDNDGNVSKISEYYWRYLENQDGLTLCNGQVRTYSYSNGNVTAVSYDFGLSFEYDNHPSPLSFPVGVVESLSFPLKFGDKYGGLDYTGFIFDRESENVFFGNFLGNKNNMTRMNYRHYETTYSYDYDASGMYPTTMYIVEGDNKYPYFYYTYEN